MHRTTTVVAFALVLACTRLAPAQVSVDFNVNIGPPPPFAFVQPPRLVELPHTYVYVVPDIDVDLYFYDGWWWRVSDGHWFRSRRYDSGWLYFRDVPLFYRHVPGDWRRFYRDRQWRGASWDYRPLPHREVERNWRGWKEKKTGPPPKKWREPKPDNRGKGPPHREQGRGRER
jgi:hypothetical protein